MPADCAAAEKSCVLHLCVLAGQCGDGAVGGSALGEKLADSLLPGCRRADLAVSCRETESCGQTECDAAENARRSPVRRAAIGQFGARKTTQRQAQVPRSPLFCSATRVHTRHRARGGALRVAKEKASLI